MGHSIICACGQRNNLAVFAYGEAKLCHACGRILPEREAQYLEESFVAEVPSDDFTEDGDPSSEALTSFESPSAIAGPEEETLSQRPPERRIWMEGVRETAADDETERCIRCSRTFRGAWDRHETANGALCHLCAVKANDSYRPPSQGEKRELFRPAPPKKIATPQAPGMSEEQARKKRGLLILAVVGVVTVVGAVVFPVEVWVAEFFSADMERAQELSVAWYWVIKILGFLMHTLGQAAGLYVTLAMMDMLYKDDKRQNLISVTGLAVVFVILNIMLKWGMDHFGVFGPLAGILIGMAVIVSFVIKLLMISGQFPLRLEGGVGFVMAYFICSLVLGPAMQMMERLLYGIIAGIAL